MSCPVEISIRAGQTIRALRKARGMTQEELVFKSNMGTAHLREIELGRGNPTLKTFYYLAVAMNIPLPVVGIILLENEEIWDLVQETRKTLWVPRRELAGVAGNG